MDIRTSTFVGSALCLLGIGLSSPSIGASPMKASAVGISSASAQRDVYFVGLDQRPAGEQGKRIARLFKVSPTNRWALSDVARNIAKELNNESIGLDAPIDRWNPATDPYNFGLMLLRSASHRTLTWQGTNSRTQVIIELDWLQIGHDPRTRMQQEKLPELRYSVSVYDVPEFNSERPPTAIELDNYYRESFSNAIRSLLRLVNQRAERDLQRDSARLRYLVIQSPVVLPRAATALAQFPNSDSMAAERLSRSLKSYLEAKLIERFKAEGNLDQYVLLPNAQTIEYLQTEWNAFASRVAALSTYNAAEEALGFRQPRLLRIVPFCTVLQDNEVHALEIRSNLVDIRTQVTPDNSHAAQLEWVDVTAHLAADIKLTLDDSRHDTTLSSEPPLQAIVTSQPVQKPKHIAAEEFIGTHSALRAIGFASDRLASQLSDRLHTLLGGYPLSHPSYQRFCP